MDGAKARSNAKVGLQILVLASKWPDQDVTISYAEALDIADWADSDPGAFRNALGGNWTSFITFAFEQLMHREVITGIINEEAKVLTVRAAAGVRSKLDEVGAENAARIDVTRAALAKAKGQAPDAPGPFVDLAREIGFEP